jgi:cellulose synthase operon protein C
VRLVLRFRSPFRTLGTRCKPSRNSRVRGGLRWLRRLGESGACRAPILVGVLLCMPLVARAEPPPAAKPPPSRQIQERSLAGARDPGQHLDLTAPENLESRMFMSERPSGRVDLAKRKEAAQLDRMLKEREKLLKLRREQAIAQLTVFVEREPESSEYMADALLRLAELRWEQARIVYLGQYARWQRTPADKRSPEPPTADIALPLSLYDRILEQHAGFDRYDLALYMKAYALVEAGRTREALFAYRRIIDEFPNSRFVPDAHMAFAEWHFSGSFDYAAALEEFEQVLAHPQSELSDLALFKSAWCLWKLGRSSDAAKRFRAVLDLGAGKLAPISAERQRRVLELQDEALEYLIQVFTEDEGNTAADLHGFLREIGGEKYAIKVLRRLSRAFFDQARYERAVQAYSMLLQSEPDSRDAPEYQSQIAAAYAAQDDAANTILALVQLARAYKPGSPWAQRQAVPELAKQAAFSAERAVRVQAMRYHERGQKEKQQTDLKHAAELYRVHLTEFPSSVFNYEVAFYLGEILFHHLKQPREAGEMYLRAAKLRPKGELTRDALYNSIVAFEQVRKSELEACKGSATKAQNPGSDPAAPTCRETDTDRSFSEAIALYIERFPDDPEVPGILFRQGRMYFDRGVYDPAVRQFGQLLDSYPKSEYAASAGELVLESFNRSRDYRNIEIWARKLKRAPAFKAPEAQRKLDVLILQSVFKVGEELSAQKQYAQAAEAYLKAAREFPRDERASRAYYNAGQQWQLAGKFEPAAAAYNELIAQYPGSSEGALGAWAAAQMFESIVQFGDAARYYELYAEQFPKGERRSDALYNAVVLQLSAGRHDQAARDGKRFAQLFPSHESADEVSFMVGRAHEAAEHWDAAAQVYRDYARGNKNARRRVEANTRLGQVLLEAGDQRGAERALSDATQPLPKGAPATERYFAAQARFMQGDLVLADFERIRIAGERGTLAKRLEQKSELLRKAAGIYGDVVEYKVAEWVTAALFKIGQSYEMFADALRNAPVPKGMNEEQEQAYRDQLAMFIVPIEERALAAYEGGYRKAIELRVFNHWTQRLREGLTRLNQVEYPPLREIGTEMAVSSSLAPPDPLTGLRREQSVVEKGKR